VYEASENMFLLLFFVENINDRTSDALLYVFFVNFEAAPAKYRRIFSLFIRKAIWSCGESEKRKNEKLIEN
jgi:hypothetical protein